MKLQPPTAWRIGAALLWIVSIACLAKAVGDGVTAQKSLNNPYLTAPDRISMQHLSSTADIWTCVGWGLQLVTAFVLTGGIKSERVVRRIFVSLGVLIAIDGVALLLTAVIIPH